MLLKWKTPTLSWIPFSTLSLFSILGIKKFHISTSTSAIILKIQINFFFYFLSLSWQPNSNKYKEMSFQAQKFPGISKALGTQLVINRLAPLPLLHNKTQQQQPFPFPQNPFTCTRRRFDCLSFIFPKMSSRLVTAFTLDSNGDCTNPKN